MHAATPLGAWGCSVISLVTLTFLSWGRQSAPTPPRPQWGRHVFCIVGSTRVLYRGVDTCFVPSTRGCAHAKHISTREFGHILDNRLRCYKSKLPGLLSELLFRHALLRVRVTLCLGPVRGLQAQCGVNFFILDSIRPRL